MSATPKNRGEFMRALRDLIAVFERRASITARKTIERMDAELRYGDERVFDHVYSRYVFWQKRNSLDSAAVRLAEGEYFNDVQHAIDNQTSVFDAIEARARERGAL